MKSKKTGGGQFWWTTITIGIVLALIKYGIPWLSRWITGSDLPLPVPGTLFFFYTIIILAGTFVYISSDETTIVSFLAPIKSVFRGDYGKLFFFVVMAVTPVVAGYFVFAWVKPAVVASVTLRIQHPSSNFPKKYEALKNPMREPTDAQIDEFIEQANNNSVEYFPQVHDEGKQFTNIRHLPFGPVTKFLAKLHSGTTDRGLAQLALMEKRLFEGRALYQINCRPCHGVSGGGDGPMAYGFSLRPINFTDSGTIDTLVEGYTFWRIENGGPSLPPESTPWDSAMPVWKHDLTEIERWTIMLAEYDIAGVSPREPEKVAR